MEGRKGSDLPPELLDGHLLDVLGVPLASSYMELQRVPALLVRQRLILAGGRQDAQEWAQIKAKNRRGNK